MKSRKQIAKKSSEDQFMAAAIGDVEWLKQSLRNAPGLVTEFDRNGLAPIHLAALHGRLECIRYLLESCHCDVNLASSTGWRAIHLCISNQTGKRSYQCLLYLLDKGALHTVFNDDKTTPVHQAASEGHLDALELLIKLGAQIDTEDARGYLPIDLAKIWSHKKCARVLATEMWHRQKDDVAKKLHLQKKLDMKTVLKEFEQQEKLQDDMKYQGNEAFDEWTAQIEEYKATHGRKKSKQVKVNLAKQYHQHLDKEQDEIVTQLDPIQHEQKLQSSKVPKEKRQEVTKQTAEESEHLRIEKSEGEMDMILEEIEHQRKTIKEKPKWDPVQHPNDWNFSGHVKDCFNPYMTKLPDAYPRDEFTMMPHPRLSFPMELNVNTTDAKSKLKADAQVVQQLARSRLPDEEMEEQSEIIRSNSAKKPQSARTVQLFKCKTIQDVQTKKRLPDVVKKYRGEAALHLTDDATSALFKDALDSGSKLPSKTSSAKTSSSNKSHSSSLSTNYKPSNKV